MPKPCNPKPWTLVRQCIKLVGMFIPETLTGTLKQSSRLQGFHLQNKTQIGREQGHLKGLWAPFTLLMLGYRFCSFNLAVPRNESPPLLSSPPSKAGRHRCSCGVTTSRLGLLAAAAGTEKCARDDVPLRAHLVATA